MAGVGQNPGYTLFGGEPSTTGPGGLDPAIAAQIAGVYAGLQSTQTVATGQANAADIAATGATAEARAYGSEAAAAREASKVAGIAGDIAVYQQQLDVSRKLGSATAAYGAGGASLGGSVTDLMRASLQQGYLGEQMINVQTTLARAGYEEQAAAADIEQGAGTAQAAASRAVKSAYSAQAAEAAKELADLTGRYGDINTITSNATKAANAPPGGGTLSPFQNKIGYSWSL